MMGVVFILHEGCGSAFRSLSPVNRDVRYRRCRACGVFGRVEEFRDVDWVVFEKLKSKKEER